MKNTRKKNEGAQIIDLRFKSTEDEAKHNALVASALDQVDRLRGQTRAINFPASTVELLEELLKASGTGLSVDEYAADHLQHEILAAVKGEGGTPEILAGTYQLEPSDKAAMQGVVQRWSKKEQPAMA